MKIWFSNISVKQFNVSLLTYFILIKIQCLKWQIQHVDTWHLQSSSNLTMSPSSLFPLLFIYTPPPQHTHIVLFLLSSSLSSRPAIHSLISFIFLPPDLPPGFSHSVLPLPPSLSVSLAGCTLQWVNIMEAGSGAAAVVGSAALGLLGTAATSSYDIVDR